MKTIKKIQFSVLSAETIKKLSVCEITKPSSKNTFDKYHTPSDPRMGPLDNNTVCETCGFDNRRCSGHFGYISLPVPIENITTVPYIVRLLQCVCSGCGRSRIPPSHANLKGGYGKGFNKLKNIAEKGKKIRVCPWEGCGQNLFNYTKQKGKDIEKFYLIDKTKVFLPIDSTEIHEILSKITRETCDFLGFNSNLINDERYFDEDGFHIHANHPSDMVMTVIPVIPPSARPHVIREGQVCEDDITETYNTILKIKNKLNPSTNINKKTKKPKILTEHEKENLKKGTKKQSLEFVYE